MASKDEEVTPEVKLAIIQQERQIWLNTREMMTIRYRVNKRIGNAEQLKTTEKELENCETALDELDKIFTELQAKA
jgi:hypothetical protein